MGLDSPTVTFLCAAKNLGADFSSTATIGRQIFFSDAAVMARVFSALGITENADDFVRNTNYRFGEPYLRLLGARSITSFDYSPYEEATTVHDMNLPIPDSLRERFTVVHDGGTLEHVFNVPQALKNCMEMVQVGGHFMQVSPANNYLGHGFWQFSPELIFRALVPANGFEIRTVLLHEVVRGGEWYAVTDPDQVKSRVELCNSNQTYILTLARRIGTPEVFASSPQQSDYVALWEASAEAEPEVTDRASANGFPVAGANRCNAAVAASARSIEKGPEERLEKTLRPRAKGDSRVRSPLLQAHRRRPPSSRRLELIPSELSCGRASGFLKGVAAVFS